MTGTGNSAREGMRKKALAGACFFMSALVSFLFIKSGIILSEAYASGVLSTEGFRWLHVLLAFFMLVFAAMSFVSARRAGEKTGWLFMTGSGIMFLAVGLYAAWIALATAG